MEKFLILAAPRTGSNLLCTLLNSHPEIVCHHELFNPQGIFTALNRRSEATQLGSPQERDADPLGFLDRVWRTGLGYGCTGFKWTRGQNEDVLRSVLRDAGVKKIVLRRRNRMKTYVSERIAQQTQQWEVYCKRDLCVPRPRIRVEMTDLRQHIELNDRFYTGVQFSLRRGNQPHINVAYEALFDRAEQRRILGFLGVRATEHPLKAASIKQNPTDLRESVSNFDELCAGLQDTGLEVELYDREN
jgi:LPS sulfotransferase NodH